MNRTGGWRTGADEFTINAERASPWSGIMKIYAGDRTIDGIVVTVDGSALDQRLDVRRYSKNGFEWTYEGAESRQLALAILADHLGDAQRALPLVEPFMREIVANFDNSWELTSADVGAALEALAHA